MEEDSKVMGFSREAKIEIAKVRGKKRREGGGSKERKWRREARDSLDDVGMTIGSVKK